MDYAEAVKLAKAGEEKGFNNRLLKQVCRLLLEFYTLHPHLNIFADSRGDSIKAVAALMVYLRVSNGN